MEEELWQAFVQIVGAVNALLLGVVLLASPRLRKTRARRKLGVAFLAYAYLLFTFTAVDNGWIEAARWIWLVDYLVVLMASALFLDYMSASLGRGDVSRLFYLPPILVFLLVTAFGKTHSIIPAINVVILVQLAYSALTTWLFFRHSRELVTRPRHLYVLLIGLWTLHGAQLLRMLLPDVGLLFDAVPLVGAALMIILTVLVLLDARTMRQFSEVLPQKAVAQIGAGEADAYMISEQPYLDPNLTLKQLGAALGIPGRELSRLIGSFPAGNFYNYVNQFRVEEAKRLLASPQERRTSIEAIGLMSGFRARSTFYEAFRRETEKTPAQFREELTKVN
jgi:AraC-like DNA-binding protein